VLTHGSALRCHGAAPADCEAQSGDHSHSQQEEPLLEFPDIPVFPPVPDPYASLTPAELATFGIGPTRVFDDDDDDEE
jgi:hypothetical protein